MRSKFDELIYSEQRILPNKLSIAQGELIRRARLEAGISQSELAERAFFKQSSISKIETGIRSISTEDLIYLSYALDKPVSYFFPAKYTEELGDDEVSVLEKELLIQTRQLSKDDLRILIAQAKAIAKFRPSTNETEAKHKAAIDLFESLVGKPVQKRRKKK